jgi:hypothetical protein
VRLSIESVGAWGDGFSNWAELHALIKGEVGAEAPQQSTPKPEVIPANERRRAPLSAKLAVEVCSQAIRGSHVGRENMPCVFVSGLGDMDLTDYMCRQLASENKLLSPTKFHNSVHNAPAGYWTIATGCTEPATALAGLYCSVTEGLLEALVQCRIEGGPVLLAVYDTPSTVALSDLYPCEQTFAAAFVLSNGESETAVATLDMEIESCEDTAWPQLELPDGLQACYHNNIAARSLSLLAPVARGSDVSMELPLNNNLNLKLSVCFKGAAN